MPASRSDVLRALGSKLSTLNVQHEIASADILHYEIYTCLGLKTGVKVQEERMPLLVGNQEHPLLGFGAFHFVVLNNEFLFEHFDGIQFLRGFRLRQHDLTKVAFAQHSKEVKMLQTDSFSFRSRL